MSPATSRVRVSAAVSSASSPGQSRRDPSEGNPALDDGQRTQFAGRQLIQPILGEALLRWRTLKCDTACQGSARPVAFERRIRNMDEVQRRVQAEPGGHRSPAARPRDADRSTRQRSRHNCVRSPSRVRRRVRYIDTQKVPRVENIQYQNQMTRPVPPHAAT